MNTRNHLVEGPDVDPDVLPVEREFPVGELQGFFFTEQFSQTMQGGRKRTMRRVTIDAWPQRFNDAFLANIATAAGNHNFQ